MLKRLITLFAAAMVLPGGALGQLPGGTEIQIDRTPVVGGTAAQCLYITSTLKVGKQACGTGTAADITVGTTTVTGAASGDILTRGASALGKLTPGTGVSTALAVNAGANGGLAVVTGTLAAGNVACQTATGIQDCGVAPITSANGGTVWGNATASPTTPAFSSAPVLGVAATTAGTIGLANGSATGKIVTIQNPSATAAAFNFNLPATAGTSGTPLLSGGGGSTAMTWGTLSGSGSFIMSSGSPTFESSVFAGTAASSTGSLGLANGGGSGKIVTIQNPSATAANYNFNLPATEGSSGTPLLSGGGGSTAMTWGTVTGTGTQFVLSAGSPVFGVPASADGSVGIAYGGASGKTVSIKNPGATAADYNFNLPTTAGTSGQVLLSGGGGSTAMTWVSTSGSAGSVLRATSPVMSGPTFQGTATFVTDNTTPAITFWNQTNAGSAGETVLRLNGQGYNSAGTNANRIIMAGTFATVTAGSEESTFAIQTYTLGAIATDLGMGGGVVVGAPTGSYKGRGTLNVATGIYANNTAGVSATVTVRDAAGTGTCTLIFTMGLKTGGSC
jgi:hypothetical protein